MSFIDELRKKAREGISFGSRVYDQANVFDNNRTFTQREPVNNRPAVQQAPTPSPNIPYFGSFSPQPTTPQQAVEQRGRDMGRRQRMGLISSKQFADDFSRGVQATTPGANYQNPYAQVGNLAKGFVQGSTDFATKGIGNRLSRALPGGNNDLKEQAKFVDSLDQVNRTNQDAYRKGRINAMQRDAGLQEFNQANQNYGLIGKEVGRSASLKAGAADIINALLLKNPAKALGSGVASTGAKLGAREAVNATRLGKSIFQAPQAVQNAARIGGKVFERAAFSKAPGIKGALITGVKQGSISGAANAYAENGNPLDIAKAAVQGGAMGAALSGGLYGAGKVFGKGSKAIDNEQNQISHTRLLKEDPKYLGLAKQQSETIKYVQDIQRTGQPVPPRLASYLDQMNQAMAQRRIEFSQGGYAKNPFGKEVADGLSKEQSDFINDYANMIEGMGTGNGVSVNPETNVRQSSNYRSDLGKDAITKQGWFDEARTQIESGKGAYGASEDYKTLPTPTPKPSVVPEVQRSIRTTNGKSIPNTSIYHETGNVKELLSNRLASGLNVSTDKSLALGQGGKGVTFEWDGSTMAGNGGSIRPIKKPGTGFTTQKEYELVGGNPSQGLKSITIKPGIELSNVDKASLRNKFDKTTLEDGSTMYIPKSVQSPAPKPSVVPDRTQVNADASQTLQKAPSQKQQISQSLQLSTQGNFEIQPTQQTIKRKQRKLQVQSTQDVGQSTSSSGNTIQNIEQFVNKQVAIQEAKPQDTSRISRLKRTFVDSLSPAEDAFRKAVKDGKLSQETLDDIIVKNGKSLRSGTAANLNLVDSGLVDLLQGKSKTDYDNLGQTLIAIHSKDLRTNGIETGRNVDIDQQLINKYAKKFEADIKQFRDSANYVLDESVRTQLIGKETANMLKKKYPNYVPMNRVIEELQNTGSFGSNQIASIGQQSVVRKIKGSKRTVENPMESMISKVQDMTRQGLKNEAGIAWVDALKETGDAKLVKGNVRPGESTISVLRNGNKEIYSVDPEMEQAAKGLTKEQMGTITNAARKVSRIFKTGTTGLNLPFIVTNLARDQQNALLNQGRGELQTFKAIPGAIMETLGHGDLYKEAVRNGAISTSFDLTRPNLKQTAENIRKKGTKLGVLSKIEDVIGRSEEYTRIQQYKASKDYWLKQGLSDADAQNKATVAAQQNSADFARAGDLGQILNAWLPYTNAGVQGTRSTLRAAKNNPARYATKAGAMLVLPTIMTTLWNTADEERKAIYDDISEFEKQSSTIIITPWAKKSEDGKWQGIVKIPKPPGISALMYPVEKGVASMKDLDPVTFGDITKGILGFGSPLGDNTKSAISTITPQAIKPAVETTLNRNLFTGRDIVPYFLKNKPTNEQAYSNTSGTARLIGGATNTSPLNIEHLLKGYTGELGLQGLNAVDNALAKTGLIPKEQIGGRSVPRGFTRRFSEAYDVGKNSKIADGAKTGDIKSSNADAGKTSENDKIITATQKKIDTATAKLPQGVSEESKKVLVNYARLSDEGRAIYNAKNNNVIALKTAQLEVGILKGTLSESQANSLVKQIAKLKGGTVAKTAKTKTARSSGVRNGRGRSRRSSAGIDSTASKVNRITSGSYRNLDRLLAGTKGSTSVEPRQVATRKPVLKQIRVRA